MMPVCSTSVDVVLGHWCRVFTVAVLVVFYTEKAPNKQCWLCSEAVLWASSGGWLVAWDLH